MVDFLQSNSSLIITLLITLSASIIPIPFVVEKLISNFKETNKVNSLEAKSIAEMADRINEKDMDGESGIDDNSKNAYDELNLYDIESIIDTTSTVREESIPYSSTAKMGLSNNPKTDFTISKTETQKNDNLFSGAAVSFGGRVENAASRKQPSPKYSSAKIVSLYELYEKRNIDKFLKKVSFILAVIMSIIGTIIIFTGIIISLFSTKEIGWITTSSGAIIEIVASIYFWLLNKTMKEVKYNSKQLEKTEDLITAIELVERISDSEIKDTAYKDMIDKLLSYDK